MPLATFSWYPTNASGDSDSRADRWYTESLLSTLCFSPSWRSGRFSSASRARPEGVMERLAQPETVALSSSWLLMVNSTRRCWYRPRRGGGGVRQWCGYGSIGALMDVSGLCDYDYDDTRLCVSNRVFPDNTPMCMHNVIHVVKCMRKWYRSYRFN